MSRYQIVPLTRQHDRASFCSGVEALDHFLGKQASQEEKRKIARCFVAVSDDSRIAGFYTLSASSLDLSEIPDDLARKLPRYPSHPVALIGRLAVDRNHQGQGLGAALLVDALKKLSAASNPLAVFALLVKAKDEQAIAFYRHFGFSSVRSRNDLLFLPLPK